jgi:MinD superfamily P-loop ATPase
VNRFQISAGCIINKADINQDVVNHIEIYLRENNIVHLTDLPYDESFTSAMTIGQTIVEYDHDKLADLLTVSWNKIKQILSKEQQ